MSFPDFLRSPNQANDVDLYDIENAAVDRSGRVLDALRDRAPWAGRTLLDLGCGSGFWLPIYGAEAATVIGVEPDADLVAHAEARTGDAQVLHGSAEHIPLPDSFVDVVHARFAYFFPPGCDAGLDEVLRVLRPGGTLTVIDNDLRHGEFGALVARSPWAAGQGQADTTDEWWQQRGADRTEIMSTWTFDTRRDLERVMSMELPPDIVEPWLNDHPNRTHLTYGYVLFSVTKRTPAAPEHDHAVPG